MAYETRIGLTTLDKHMTPAQAMRYGQTHMPADLKRIGYVVVLCMTDHDIHGWSGIRINYARSH